MKYNDILKILLLLVVLVLIGILLFYFWGGITGQVIFNNITYHTKAICNDGNYCQDYEIYCDGEEFVEMIPITGAEVWHNEDWVDPRGKELAAELC